ncbi:MAG: 30S ribosomal protein S20 [Deltaproteobacteria bacterium]|jgi:small subunit ribosomal protein S20|nr:30S ribosomal protein S20 [Deltaproteobacteria bacterium]
MANHKSALKRHEQSLKRAARNRSVRSRVKNAIKGVRTALQANNQELAAQALLRATSIIDRASTKGVVHWKNAARKVSRLAKAVNAATAAVKTPPQE